MKQRSAALFYRLQEVAIFSATLILQTLAKSTRWAD